MRCSAPEGCAEARRGREVLRTLSALALAGLLLAGCGGTRRPASDAADRAFVSHMLPHHQRAIAVGRLAITRGADPRVRAFGQRIVREQTPELERLRAWSRTLGARPDAAKADARISDAELARLRSEAPRAFDRDVLLASAASEAGAARMAQVELAHGRYAPARRMASSISTAPEKEIPQLRALAVVSGR